MRRTTLSAGVRAARDLRAHSTRLGLEILEDRLLPSAGLADVAMPDIVLVNSDAAPMTGSGLPDGFSPQQISQAYGFNEISFENGAIKGNGSGQTIAIVDAYNQPDIASNLATFDAMYGLPAANLTVVNQSGGNTLPSSNQQWGLEESLDVEWAHAIAPGANIILVEANSNSYSDLMTAVNYARNVTSVSVVSMSWGSSEFVGETAYDSDFTTPSDHQGVTFVASSGDDGYVEYPSASPNVLTVGGTQLTTDSDGDYEGETAWDDGGGGISTVEDQPSYQEGVVTQTSSNRAVPDVSYDASPSTPYAIYDTSSESGWVEVGGTSAGAPQWAALIAIADQGRAVDDEGTLNGATQTLPALYQLPQSDFHDITSGSNGTYSAGTGYDLVTGRGSPIANLVVSGLVAYGATSESPPVVAKPISLTSSTNTTANFSVLGSDSSGSASLTYTWSVLSEPSGAEQPTFSINGTNGAQNTTVTFYDAGAYIFQVTITNVYGQSVSTSVNATVSQVASGLTLSPANGSVNDNGTLQFTATATDQFGHAMNAQPSWNWSLSGGGSLNGGLYTAPSSGNGTAVIYVSGDGLTQSASVTFQAAPSTPVSSPVSPPEQSQSGWLQFLDTWFAELSQLESMWQLLLASGSAP